MDIHTVSVHRPSIIRQFQHRFFLVTLVLLLTILLSMGVNIDTMISQQVHSVRILLLHDDVNQLLSAMTNQETGLRGYIVTADPSFLQPFSLGHSQYLSTITSLNTGLHDRDWQIELPAFSQVQAHAERWYRLFALPLLFQMHLGNFALPRSRQSALTGKVLFDSFRKSLAELQQLMNKNDAFLFTQQNGHIWSALIAGTLVSFFALFLLRHIFLVFRRDFSTQLTMITMMAQRFQMGQHQARIPTLKHEEMEFVGHTFNHLVETIEQQNAMVEDHIQQLNTVNGEFRALFHAVTTAILFVSRDGQILTVNHSFTTFFQVSPETITGQLLDSVRAAWASLFVDPSCILEFLHSYDSDETDTPRVLMSQKSPKKREMEGQSLPVLSTTGSFLGRLYLFRDVTHEYELERLKRDFVSQVSHELRTPLTSVKGFVDLLLEEPDRLDTDQQEFLQIIHENAHRLVTLVNDLLDIARIESGNMKLERSPLVLNPLIETTLQAFSLSLKAKQQSLEVSLHHPSPVVFADSIRLQQILSNLVSNAHKYTLPGGTLRVSTQLEEHQVWIAVQDSGVGMTQEEQALLFSQFFRAKNPQMEDVGGTGLGLAITRSLVELHGGVMQVESQPGQGSIFRFPLPLDTPISHRVPLSPRHSGKKRVLIVEDDLDNAYLLQHLCERQSYEVLVAHSGQEGVHLATHEIPDLMILDLILPDISGFVVLEEVKQHPQTAGLPVLLLSRVDQEGRGRFLGAVDYLSKPFRQEELLAHLRALLSEAPASILVLAHDGEGALLHDYAQQHGYTLITANTSTQLLALVRRHRPSLIVLDSELPPDGGLAVLQLLRSAPEQAIQTLPILILAAREGTLSEQLAAVEQTGDIQILGRSCQMEEIAQAITHQFARGVKR